MEHYRPDSAKGRIARAVETAAAWEWGPAGLTKEKVATALNIDPGAITEEEWADISEFAVNAGAESKQAVVDRDVPQDPTYQQEKDAYSRIFNNRDNLMPAHDIFHAAEIYAEQHAAAAAVPISKVSRRERYADPNLIRTELWPLLFFVVPEARVPLSVGLTLEAERENLITRFAGPLYSGNQARDEIRDLLEAPQPATPEEMRGQYEELVVLVIVANAIDKLPDLTQEERRLLDERARTILEDPPEHYARFANRVFAQEWKTNPRLFLDEFLSAIRTTPVPAQSHE